MECRTCKELTEVIDELSHELSKVQKSRRQILRTMRLLRMAVINEMEKEFQESVSQADGFGEES
jgi:hypothetical protein